MLSLTVGTTMALQHTIQTRRIFPHVIVSFTMRKLLSQRKSGNKCNIDDILLQATGYFFLHGNYFYNKLFYYSQV